MRSWVDELMRERPRSKLITLRDVSGSSGTVYLNLSAVPFRVGGAHLVGMSSKDIDLWGAYFPGPPFVSVDTTQDGLMRVRWFLCPSSATFDITINLIEAQNG